MQIHIHSQGFLLTEALRAHIERRIHFALSWAAEQIRSVTVRLSDQNGTRGGIDKRCRFLIGVKGAADIVISETQADMYAAIDRAADRAGRTITRSLTKMRHYQHENLTVIDSHEEMAGKVARSWHSLLPNHSHKNEGYYEYTN
jgi:putative sigma-54 modulation protein